MPEVKKQSLLSFFSYAREGILRVIKTERNFKIHLLAAFLVVLLGLFVGINKTEWLVLILIIFSVLAAETFNSALEETANVMKKRLDLDYNQTTFARNMSAGAVLLLAIASVIIGLIIFLPYFL